MRSLANRPLTERAAWEDREDEHAEHSDDGGVDYWGGATEQDAQADCKESEQREDQQHQVPAKSDAPLHQATEKLSYASLAMNEGDQMMATVDGTNDPNSTR